jgi:LysR family transcriptional regulator, regulator for bpeEF and oprC
MDRLHAMLVFAKVVETGSFARAADALGLARPSITVTIQNLESYLKTQLVQRSTRQLNVTADGETFYRHCTRVLSDVSEIEDCFNIKGSETRGRLRIALPAYVAKKFVVPRLCEFRDAYRDIDLALTIVEPTADISVAGADCLVRLGPLPDSNLVARPLATLQIATVASEDYLRRYGIPRTPEELASHAGIRHGASITRHCEMSFRRATESVHIRLSSQIAVDDTETAIACAASGLGVVQSFRFLIQPYIISGQLLEILPEQCPTSAPLFTIYPKTDHRSRALRTFVDWLHRVFQQAPALRIHANSLPDILLSPQVTNLATPSHERHGEAKPLLAG